MKLDMKNEADRQKVIAAGLIVVILIAGFVVLKLTLFSGGSNAVTDTSTSAAVAPPTDQPPPSDGAVPPQPGAAPTAGPVAPAQPGAAPPAEATAAAPTPSAAPTPGPSPVAGASGGQKTLTVFGSVTLTYPSGWGIGLGSIGSAAVVSDGKARFEVHAPNPKADNAKAIADSALASMGAGGKVVSQGPMKIGQFDAYQYTTSAAKIIGIDAPTRIVVVESVKGGNLAAYRPIFDKMESQLSFR